MPLLSVPTDGQAVTITELVFPFRVVRLAGRDRPEQPVEISSEQRATQTWYPGQDKASVQFMGTKHDPVILRGWWQDPLSQLAGTGPDAMEAQLRGMQNAGSLCQLIWGSVINRQGRIQKFTFGIHRQHRVRFEITFAVDQADEAAALKPIAVIPGTAAAFAASMRAAIETARTCLDAVRVFNVVRGVTRTPGPLIPRQE